MQYSVQRRRDAWEGSMSINPFARNACPLRYRRPTTPLSVEKHMSTDWFSPEERTPNYHENPLL